jgi:hypothetical protein
VLSALATATAALWSPAPSPAEGVRSTASIPCAPANGTVSTFAPGQVVDCYIPQNVDRIRVVAWGAQGGEGGPGHGVAGGYAVRTFNVVPGVDTFKVAGGQEGGNGCITSWGCNNGGGGGGGASGVYTGELPPTSLNTVIVIAGGGGGGGCDDGGVGGGTPAAPDKGVGQNGYGCSGGYSGRGGGLGKGGTTDGFEDGTGGFGWAGRGGNGADRYGGWGGGAGFSGVGGPGTNHGGGGGGGYGGGAGGNRGGGGGGGSYPASLSDRYNYGNGVVSIQSVAFGLKQMRCEFSSADKPDRLVGTPADETICGRGARDKIFGDEGRDVLIGGPGADRMRGGKGLDICNGGPGADVADSSCEKVISASRARG